MVASIMRNAEAVLDGLRGVLGGRATNAPSALDQHGRSEAYHAISPPDIVVFPETTAEVSAIVRQCAQFRCPIPFGANTSLKGNAAAAHELDAGRL